VLLVAIPVIAWLFISRFLFSFLVSSVLGTLVLWAKMVRLEVFASDSDFDVVFGVSMGLWGIALVGFYGLSFAVAWGIQNLLTRGAGERLADENAPTKRLERQREWPRG
jgi:hypothetical protein